MSSGEREPCSLIGALISPPREHPHRVRCQGGFILPAVIFGLMMMSAVAIVALATSHDEFRSARAMRESSGAFYAAEAGLNEIYATWDTWQAAIDSLAPGDSIDMGWRPLDNGATYRGLIQRWDNGGQPMFHLVVEGNGSSRLSGEKMLSFVLTAEPAGPGEGYSLGDCCQAVATVRGDIDATHDGTTMDGHDEHPAGCGTGPLTGWCYDWTAAEGVCSDSLYDKPAFRMQDTTLFYTDGEAALDGVPILEQDASIDDMTFHEFGDLTWDDIKDMADHVVGIPGEQVELIEQIYPRYNADGSCDTSHPYNWGSPDPDDPCFDYFPIILAKGNFEYEGSYGQAVVILDYDAATMTGSEFELEDNSIFNGIILGKGCVEIQYEAQFHGALFVDGMYQNDLCGVDKVFDLNKTGHANYSQCAVDRAIINSGLYEYAEAAVPPEFSGATLLQSRSFGEMFQ